MTTGNATSRGAQGAFERAQHKYRKRLTEQELAQMKKLSGIDQLINRAQIVGEDLGKEDPPAYQERISKLASNLKPFERMLEGVCKLSPMGGDLIWGSVSFLLEAARNEKQISKEVMDFFLDMAYEMEYLRTVEVTFGNSSMVVVVVEAVYVAILEFWVKAVRYYRQRLKPGFWFSMMNFMTSSNIALEFSQMRAEIASQETKLHLRASAQHHAHEELDRAQLQNALQAEFIRWIGAPKYESDFLAADRRRYEGTCEWLGRKLEYVNWTEQGITSFLVIYGIAGAGKTILTSWLIKQARSCDSEHLTIYHYFKDTDDSKNTPLAATRSFLEQTYRHVRQLGGDLASTLGSELARLRADSPNGYMDFEPLWDILSSALSSFPRDTQSKITRRVTIILDALDECRSPKQLIRSLRHLVYSASGTIRLVITARRSGAHVDEFMQRYSDQCLPTFLDISQEDVQHDIESFTKYKICKIPRLRNPEHKNLRDRIIATFGDTRHHQGMFLWAYLMCKEIKYPQSIQDTWDLLENVPSGLAATYERICARLLRNDARYRDFGNLVLRWIFASNRPLRFVELKEALKIKQAQPGWFGKKQLFNGNDELIWSREDVVKSCGDLVRYSGLDEEDTIAPVHLSAQQFFSMSLSMLSQQHPAVSPDIIGSFLVDIPRTELMIATTCVSYLLSTSPYSDQYLSPVAMDSVRTPNQESFRKLYPFLDYSVMYWIEYLLNALEAWKDSNSSEVQQLFATTTEFIRSPASVIWIEEWIRLTYLEFAQNTIRRLTILEQWPIPSDLSSWAELLMGLLLYFSRALTTRPQMVRLCMHQIESAAAGYHLAPNQGIQPLEAIERGWIHYDPLTDSLFSFDKGSRVLDPPKLRCQVVRTSRRRRPLPAAPQDSSAWLFSFTAAAISTCSRFIAAIYRRSADKVYCVTCWNISGIDGVDGTNDWANVVFHRIMKIPHTFRACIAFNNDNALITPDGVFNLETQKCIIRSGTIYDSQPRSSPLYVGGRGGRTARINLTSEGYTVEVLDLNGAVIFERASNSRLHISGFSDTGTKLIIYIGRPTRKHVCLLVNEGKEIEMRTPSDDWEITPLLQTMFTEDEAKFVAALKKDDQGLIGVWNLPDYGDAQMVRIYVRPAEYRFCFDLRFPKDPSPSLLLVDNRTGVITRHSINVDSLPEANSTASRRPERTIEMIVDIDSDPKLVIWSLFNAPLAKSQDMIRVETWALRNSKPERLSQIEAPISPNIVTQTPVVMSPGDDYLSIGSYVVEAHMSPMSRSPGSHAQDDILVRDTCLSAARRAFYRDGTRLAYYDHYLHELTVITLDAAQGFRSVRQASFRFDIFDHCGVIFSPNDPDLLAVGRYVVRLGDEDPVVEAVLENNIEGFSTCGSYCYTRFVHHWPKVHTLRENTLRTSSPPKITFPTSFELDKFYVCPPYVMRLRLSARVIYLVQKSIDGLDNDAYFSRPIGVLTDGQRRFISLVFPYEDKENLKFIVMEEAPKLIVTAIRKDELMNESEWVRSTGNNY